MKTHCVRRTPDRFDRLWDGSATCDIRYDDRGYQAGDLIVIREFREQGPVCGCHGGHKVESCTRFSGRSITAVIGHVQGDIPSHRKPEFRAGGFVVLSLLNVTRHGVADEPPHPQIPVAPATGAAPAIPGRTSQVAPAEEGATPAGVEVPTVDATATTPEGETPATPRPPVVVVTHSPSDVMARNINAAVERARAQARSGAPTPLIVGPRRTVPDLRPGPRVAYTSESGGA